MTRSSMVGILLGSLLTLSGVSAGDRSSAALLAELANEKTTTRITANPLCADCVDFIRVSGVALLRFRDPRSGEIMRVEELDLSPGEYLSSRGAIASMLPDARGKVATKECSSDNAAACVPVPPTGYAGPITVHIPVFNEAGKLVGYITITYYFVNGNLADIGMSKGPQLQ